MYQNFQKSLRNTRKNFMAVSNFDVTFLTKNSITKVYYVLIKTSQKALSVISVERNLLTRKIWKVTLKMPTKNQFRQKNKCDECEISFNHPSALKIHVKEHYEKMTDHKLSCRCLEEESKCA